MTKKIVLAITFLFLLTGTVAGSAFAAPEGTRPGWGHGDRNHDHYGPPGLSVRPTLPPEGGLRSNWKEWRTYLMNRHVGDRVISFLDNVFHYEG